jgi:hypothetical protein
MGHGVVLWRPERRYGWRWGRLDEIVGNAGRRLSRHLDRRHVWFDWGQRCRLVPKVLGKLLARAGHRFPILRTSVVPECLARTQEKGAEGLEAMHRYHVGVVFDMPKRPRDVIVDEVYLERRVGDAQVPNPDQDVIERRCKGQGGSLCLLVQSLITLDQTVGRKVLSKMTRGLLVG